LHFFALRMTMEPKIPGAIIPRRVFTQPGPTADISPSHVPRPDSATGYSIARVFNRLGITEPMKAKMKAQPNPAQVVAVVAKGEVELGIFLINVLTAPGLDVVGPFPAELQENVVFTAAVTSGAKDAAAAKALIEYLKGPAAVATSNRMA
jgi:ABC-type molybdate transport system substrate-binding protein